MLPGEQDTSLPEWVTGMQINQQNSLKINFSLAYWLAIMLDKWRKPRESQNSSDWDSKHGPSKWVSEVWRVKDKL